MIFSFPDIDECSSMPCDHICHNVPGSFVCECRTGYILFDNVRCIGKQSNVTACNLIYSVTVIELNWVSKMKMIIMK